MAVTLFSRIQQWRAHCCLFFKTYRTGTFLITVTKHPTWDMLEEGLFWLKVEEMHPCRKAPGREAPWQWDCVARTSHSVRLHGIGSRERHRERASSRVRLSSSVSHTSPHITSFHSVSPPKGSTTPPITSSTADQVVTHMTHGSISQPNCKDVTWAMDLGWWWCVNTGSQIVTNVWDVDGRDDVHE